MCWVFQLFSWFIEHMTESIGIQMKWECEKFGIMMSEWIIWDYTESGEWIIWDYKTNGWVNNLTVKYERIFRLTCSDPWILWRWHDVQHRRSFSVWHFCGLQSCVSSLLWHEHELLGFLSAHCQHEEQQRPSSCISQWVNNEWTNEG